MLAHRIETTLEKDGTVTLSDLPFHAGDAVEIIILAREEQASQQRRYALRGTPVRYERPTEPVAADEWDTDLFKHSSRTVPLKLSP